MFLPCSCHQFFSLFKLGLNSYYALSMFLTFSPPKPHVLLLFVLIKKKRLCYIKESLVRFIMLMSFMLIKSKTWEHSFFCPHFLNLPIIRQWFLYLHLGLRSLDNTAFVYQHTNTLYCADLSLFGSCLIFLSFFFFLVLGVRVFRISIFINAPWTHSEHIRGFCGN